MPFSAEYSPMAHHTALIPVYPGRPPILKVKGTWIYVSVRDQAHMTTRSEWRGRLVASHPDRGGSVVAFTKVHKAYEKWQAEEVAWYEAYGLTPPSGTTSQLRIAADGRINRNPRRPTVIESRPCEYCGRILTQTLRMLATPTSAWLHAGCKRDYIAACRQGMTPYEYEAWKRVRVDEAAKRNKERMAELRSERRDAGLCLRCGVPTHGLACALCQERHLNNRLNHQYMKEMGV